MALDLSARAEVLSQKRNIKPNLILEIDGVDTIYSAIITLEAIKFGGSGVVFGQPGIIFGGSTALENNEALISLGGSGNTISQQLLQDKGGVSSVSSLSIELLDKNGLISELISPGFVVEDLLTQKARVYLNFENGIHPRDSVLIHRGIIDEITPLQGAVKLNIAHPEQMKRQDLFILQNTQLNGAVNNSVTTIAVDTTAGFILPVSPELLSYIKIGDEIIQYTGFSSTQFTGCTRASLGTIAASHADNDEVSSFYRLQDNGIDLALKIMLSLGDDLEKDVLHIGATSVVDLDPNVVFFDDVDIEKTLGLVVGDFISITGSGFGGNNLTLEPITGFGTAGLGSYVTVDVDLDLELTSPAEATFKSKYNILTEGMGMTMQDVDVERHETLQTRFSSTIPDYDFYIKDTVSGKEFLSEQIYFPAGMYSLPRKSKASVGITVPPIAEDQAQTLDERTIYDASQLKAPRSINKNFYNAVVIKYNEALDEDKFLSGKVEFSADSQSRIANVGNKPFTIESKGLRPSDATETLIRLNTRRILERYQFAAELIPGVKVLYKTGFKIECGDIVVANPQNLTDLDEGSRNRRPKLYEVVNKSLNIKTGEVVLDLLATNFAIDGRYGVVSPSTLVGVGSTTTSIVIKDSYSTTAPKIERDKWEDFVGLPIKIHSPDWTFDEDITLVEFDSGDDYKMIVSPALSLPPTEDYIIDIPYYENVISDNSTLYKLMFCHFDPRVLVDTGISTTQFTVGAGDVVKIFVGSIVRVHNTDFSIDSEERVVTDITGVTITVDETLGFTPATGQEIDLIGFQDGDLPYRLI